MNDPWGLSGLGLDLQVNRMLMWTGQFFLSLPSRNSQFLSWDYGSGMTGKRRSDRWIAVMCHQRMRVSVCVCVTGQRHMQAYLLQWRVPFHPAYPVPRSPSRTPDLSAPRRAAAGRSVCRRAGWAAPWSESKHRASAALQRAEDGERRVRRRNGEGKECFLVQADRKVMGAWAEVVGWGALKSKQKHPISVRSLKHES